MSYVVLKFTVLGHKQGSIRVLFGGPTNGTRNVSPSGLFFFFRVDPMIFSFPYADKKSFQVGGSQLCETNIPRGQNEYHSPLW